VDVLDDFEAERGESFYVGLSGISGNAYILGGPAEGLIIDSYYGW
jgi:hypothetical protein